jgi:hypothetical protein
MRTKSLSLVLASLCVVLTVAGCGGSDKKTSTTTTTSKRAAPVAVTTTQLSTFAGTLGHPLYWIGTKRNTTYELTQTKDGSVYLRYLPTGVTLGSPQPSFLTVGTYPNTSAFAALTKAGKRKGATVTRLANGGISVSQADRPQSVYFTYPDSKLIVEVFDPSAARAARLVKSGKVLPVR